MGSGKSPIGGGGGTGRVISPFEADSFFGNQWDSDLKSDEEVAMWDYADSGYEAVNSSLWDADGDPSRIPDSAVTSEGMSVLEEISSLDSAIAKAAIPETIIVYRGDQGDIFNGMDASQINKMKGQRFQNMGYSSSSISQDAAFQKKYIYKITVPKGKGHGAFIRDHSPHFTEHEFLIKRNAIFKIKGAVAQGQQIVVDLAMEG